MIDIRDELKKAIEDGKKYSLIYADVPAHFKTYSTKGELKAPQRHYPTMSVEEIKALPVKEIAADNSILVYWVYQPLLPQAIETMQEWGFEYKTIGFVWRKLTKHGKTHMSTGYYTRAGMEMCLIGRRGNPPRPANKGIRQVFESPVREHSQKPDEMYDFLEALYPTADKLELFARNKRAGWDSFGNEVGKFL